MANRSYLYTYHPNHENKVRDLAEWNSSIPASHYLLVGSDCEAVHSEIWTVDEKVALRGNGAQGRELMLSFLDWLKPQVWADAEREISDAKNALLREDRQGEFFHLEPGEVYELSGYSLEEMESQCLDDVGSATAVAKEVRRLLGTPGSTIEDYTCYELSKSKEEWDKSGIGLYFSCILYFHLGK